MAKVRVHLRLSEPAKAESVLLFKRAGKNGKKVTFPVAAYAGSYVLKNVRPVFAEGPCVKGNKASTAPGAWLEGDLVAWEGRFRKGIDPAIVAALSESKTKDLFNEVAETHRITLQEGPHIGSDPQKAKEFFEIPAEGEQIRMAFVKAGSLVARHWQLAVRDAVFRPFEPGEIKAKAGSGKAAKPRLARGGITL